MLAVLPTGFGKSLIAPFADFIEPGKSIVIVTSALKALIKDQVTRLGEKGLKSCILKADRVASDCQDMAGVSVISSHELQNLSDFQLIYAHPEALFTVHFHEDEVRVFNAKQNIYLKLYHNNAYNLSLIF